MSEFKVGDLVYPKSSTCLMVVERIDNDEDKMCHGYAIFDLVRNRLYPNSPSSRRFFQARYPKSSIELPDAAMLSAYRRAVVAEKEEVMRDSVAWHTLQRADHKFERLYGSKNDKASEVSGAEKFLDGLFGIVDDTNLEGYYIDITYIDEDDKGITDALFISGHKFDDEHFLALTLKPGEEPTIFYKRDRIVKYEITR